ncbi:10685_t:CDS:2, partial [Scutellospora calospora]
HLYQKLAEYNKAKKLFMSLIDLDYKPGYRKHTYYKYLLSFNNKNNTALLEVYHPEEIYFQYIIWIEEKGFTLVEYPFKVYKIVDSYEYIDRNQPLCPILDIDTRQKPNSTNSELPSLDSKKNFCKDLISKILIAYIDTLSLIPEYILFLQSFALAKLKGFMKKVMELVEEPYSKFINNEFKNLENYLVQPKENYSVIWPRTFFSEELVKEEF